MAYTKIGGWVNNSAPFLSDVNLQHIEDGIFAAAANADTALAAIGSAAAGLPGTVLLDSFSGATDDAKLTAAMAYAQGHPNGLSPTILFSARTYTFTQSHTTFSGLRLSGQPLVGWAGPEQPTVLPTKIIFNGGIDANSFLVGTSQNYYGYVGHLFFTSTNGNSQFMSWPLSAGSAFCWTFENLSFTGFKHVMGNPTNPMEMTCCTIKGEWTVIANSASSSTQFTLGGSDNNFWTDGSCNIGPDTNGNGNGAYLAIFNGLGKTNIGGMYFTADANWRAIRVVGSRSFGPSLYCTGFRIEGRNPTDASSGALVVIDSSNVQFRDTWLAYAMTNPSAYGGAPDVGVVQMSGGDAIFDGVTYDRASGVGTSVPLFRTTGGTLEVNRVRTCDRGGTWGSAVPVVSQNAANLIKADSSVQLVTV